MTGIRVIGGKARGRRLRSVPGDTTRPITDRTKESLFNIIGGDIVDATVLDLFAGTGSVGIEALSRGAKYVRLLDLEGLAVKTIRENLENTGLAGNADIIRTDSLKYLEKGSNFQFDYIYVAPPQYKKIWEKALLHIDAHPDWLSADAWVIVQIHPKEYISLEMNHLVEFDKRQYGSTLLVFFEHRVV